MTLATSAFAAEPGKGSHTHNPLERMQTKLNLSAEQVSRLQPTFEAAKQRHMAQREAFKAKMDGILTSDQKAAWEKSKGEHKRGGFKALNLTADQKAQMKTYWEQNRSQGQAQRNEMDSQVMAVLTPEQQTKFKEMKSRHGHHGRGGHRGHHKGGDKTENK